MESMWKKSAGAAHSRRSPSILIGGVVSMTARTNISHPGHTGPFVGTLMQFTGLAAVAAAFVAIVEWCASRIRVESPRGRTARPLHTQIDKPGGLVLRVEAPR